MGAYRLRPAHRTIGSLHPGTFGLLLLRDSQRHWHSSLKSSDSSLLYMISTSWPSSHARAADRRSDTSGSIIWFCGLRLDLLRNITTSASPRRPAIQQRAHSGHSCLRSPPQCNIRVLLTCLTHAPICVFSPEPPFSGGLLPGRIMRAPIARVVRVGVDLWRRVAAQASGFPYPAHGAGLAGGCCRRGLIGSLWLQPTVGGRLVLSAAAGRSAGPLQRPPRKLLGAYSDGDAPGACRVPAK
jgi:hypothetical protein